MMRVVELRSDTFTRPTPDMRRAMYEAEVGDDVWNEDPTIHRLEARAAELTGKDAAVFLSSGTQGNLIGVLAQTRTGDETIVGDQSHILHYEVAGLAVVGGIQLRTVSNGTDGHIDPDDVRRVVRGVDDHEPRTGCVAIENTHNRCGGRVLTREATQRVADVGREAGAAVHLDGARIFNAAVALDMPVSELASPADSITFCLSKGLGAPVGSVLCGSSDYIARARKWRKMLGGGMRQAGILAAAGLFALDHNVERLADDHENARLLAQGLSQMPGIDIDPGTVQTNMVFFDARGTGMTNEEFVSRLAERGVQMSLSGAPRGGMQIRAVTSLEVSRSDIEASLSVIAETIGVSVPATA